MVEVLRWWTLAYTGVGRWERRDGERIVGKLEQQPE
jgi:hypothetical protein